MSALWTAKAAKAKKAAKSAKKKGGSASAHSTPTHHHHQHHGGSSKRSRSEDRSDSERHSRKKARHAGSSPGTPHPSSYHATYLTEEENLACYYPLTNKPKQPPSEAFLARLHDEILSYSLSHVPTPSMTKARWSVIHSVRDASRALWGPEVDVLPFGSFVTGLYIGSSDIDLVVLDVHCSRQQVPQLLSKLGARLRKLGLARDVTIIPSARVPLLKYIDVASDIPVDISVGVVEGVESANLMRKQVDAYPAFKPLTLFLKAFMQSMGLADVFKGGISSYILQVMILFHLQVQESLASQSGPAPPVVLDYSTASASSLPPRSNLGYLLFTFFELFGFTFSYADHGIRIHDLKKSTNSRLECYNKAAVTGRLNREKPYLLSIEDPIQKERDIGANCFGIRRVQRCFAVAREFLCSEPQPRGGYPASVAPAAAAAAEQPAFVIDTVGDSQPAGSAAAAAASSAVSNASAATPSPSDPHSASFSSSFGFILSSLLSLPVRYSIDDLRRAALKQPAWGPIVAKLERLEHLQTKKAGKLARREAAAAKKKANNAAQSIDLTDADSTPTRAAAAAAADHESSASSDDDSDVEILTEHGSAHKPIPIDDMTSGDEEEDVTGADAAAVAAEESHRHQTNTTSEPEEHKSQVAPHSTRNDASDDECDDHAIDGDAMLESDHHDENMELNLA